MRQRKAVIVDDERLARKELRTLLKEAHTEEVHVVGEAASLQEAARIIEATDADLVFLDIALGRESGFDLVPAIGADIEIVFVTAHDSFALRAFEINALDYLLKPVDPERLALTIKRLGPAQQPDGDDSRPLSYDDRLFLRLNDRRAFMRIADVIAIEAAGDDSVLHLVSQTSPARTSRPLSAWDARLPERYFIRIHRSTIINLDHVVRVEEWSHASFLVYMRDMADPLSMSRRYGARVRDRLG